LSESSAYEIWNEPNAVLFSNPVDPVAYAHLLEAVYPIIKGTATTPGLEDAVADEHLANAETNLVN
jgi:hypothetical protein